MALHVDIKKRLGSFQLETCFSAENETLALLGASGCGKSVTLRCIAGILTPDEGRIVLDGMTLFDSAAKVNLPPQKREIGYLFQQYALFPNMTVRQNIAAAVRNQKKAKAVTEEKLRQFQLENVAGQRPSELSGGQQQRTALARILASEPKAILLDEPFSALDNYLKVQLEIEMAQTLETFPGTVLWVSHDRGEVYRNCDRVCVMDHGHSQRIRTLEELFRHPDTEAAARLSGCQNYADAVVRGSQLFLPAWKMYLTLPQPAEPGIRRIGIPSHHIRLSEPGAENTVCCRVVRIVQDLRTTIVLLQPTAAADGAPLLRMELDPESWNAVRCKEQVTVSLPAEEILLLKSL